MTTAKCHISKEARIFCISISEGILSLGYILCTIFTKLAYFSKNSFCNLEEYFALNKYLFVSIFIYTCHQVHNFFSAE